jgi:fructose-1,6-bisphosphatase/sedoheptulose 1,7-bisphosphatase-like protein
VRVFAIPDGDVAASILTCMPDSEVDVCTVSAARRKASFPLR